MRIKLLLLSLCLTGIMVSKAQSKDDLSLNISAFKTILIETSGICTLVTNRVPDELFIESNLQESGVKWGWDLSTNLDFQIFYR